MPTPPSPQRLTGRARTLVVALAALAGAAAPALARAQSPDPGTRLTLEQAVEVVVQRNERAQAATARAEASEARVQAARAFFFPRLTLGGNYTRRLYEVVREVGGQQVVVQRHDAFGGTANLRAPVLNARGFPLYRQAALERDAAKADALESQRLLSFEAADAFLATLSAEQVAQAATERLTFAQTALRDARARAAAKLVSTNDITRAELEVATAEREATRARGEVETAYLQLGNLLNADVQGPLAEPASLLQAAAETAPAEEGPMEAGPMEEALARRLDLKALRSRSAALEAFASEPDLRLVPSLDAVAQYRVTNESGLSGRFGDGFAGLELSWELFDNGTRYAQRRERSALARATSLEATHLERRVGLQVEQAQVALRNAQAALTQAQLAAAAAERNAKEAQVLYREGLAGSLQVADANIRLFEAQVALARERYGLALALLDVRAAAGLDPLGKEWTL